MSGFSAGWLAEREAADSRARSDGLVATLPGRFESIVDLGAGTGSNLRWLAPRLDSPQQWTLVDNDADLLVAGRKATRAWAQNLGFSARGRGSQLSVTGPDFDCRIETVRLDLAGGLGELEFPAGCLVAASALLDLVSRQWLEQLIARIDQPDASILWTLTYDGRVTIDPADDIDDAILACLNRHQATDKGFGPALGPDAWLVAQSLLDRAGFDVCVVDSSWQCGKVDKALIKTLIGGWASAAKEIAPDESRSIEKWRKQRLRQAARGELEVSVGHQDIAAHRSWAS
jgi:SAM-dependent methyltransferase